MKKNIDEMNILLERNNINLLKSAWKRDNHDQDIQPERGHAIMASTSKPRALLIELGALNHMMEGKEK